MYKKIITILFLFIGLYTTTVSAQQESSIEILNADQISFNQKEHEDRQKLYGNILVQHAKQFLSCDSAYFYSSENKLEAFSDIKIWQGDTLTLTGDYLIYYGDHQLAQMEGNVHLEHKDVDLRGEQLSYNFNYEQAFYDQRAIITQEDKSLTSDRGVYHASQEKFDFYGHVIINTSKETIEADTVYYWYYKEYAVFQGNGYIVNDDLDIYAQQGWIDQIKGEAFLSNQVHIKERDNNYHLFADSTYFTNHMQEALSYSNTYCMFPFEDDTLLLVADTLRNEQIASNNLLKAYYNVSYKSDAIIGSCDSLTYLPEEEMLVMNVDPTMWLEDYQLTSDTLSLFFKENNLHRASLNNHSFIVSQVDSNAFNQISGKNMEAYFAKNELSNIEVKGNGESIYFVQDESKRSLKGVNKIICSNMNIRLLNKAIESIHFYKEPDAKLYPIDKIQLNDFILKGFIWREMDVILEKIEAL